MRAPLLRGRLASFTRVRVKEGSSSSRSARPSAGTRFLRTLKSSAPGSARGR